MKGKDQHGLFEPTGKMFLEAQNTSVEGAEWLMMRKSKLMLRAEDPFKTVRGDLRLVKELQNLVFEPGGANYGIQGVNNILDQEVKSLQPSFISKELDLRSNPVKGGEDGAILERLDLTNIQLSSKEEQPEEMREITPGLEAIDKGNDHLLELAKEREVSCSRKTSITRWNWREARMRPSCGFVRKRRLWRRQRQPKPNLRPKKRVWFKRKRSWTYGKAHGSDGSEEESKALEARPPDGPNVDQQLVQGLKPNKQPSMKSIHVM